MSKMSDILKLLVCEVLGKSESVIALIIFWVFGHVWRACL